MYGVSEELMQRMEKRIKEKIYRELMQEQQLHLPAQKYQKQHNPQTTKLKTEQPSH